MGRVGAADDAAPGPVPAGLRLRPVDGAAPTQAEGDDEMQYHLSLDVAVDPPRVRQVVEDGLADRYREQGWTVELDPWDDMPLRLTRDGALVAITAGPDRDGALVRGTSVVVPTPEEIRPLTAKLPFEPYTPPDQRGPG